ncbi:MAG TPA: rRNA maturation RNase YbeY [Vicinamibacterales bacterium]|jgi:probable rRNA maturation factor|nr:rRNA maturation RNase YbeY [Vicinamibacterales bacterium]
MDEDGPRLRVSISDERGRPAGDRSLAGWLARAAPARARGAVALAIVSDGYVRALNRRYRGKDAVTDVLSFPDGAGGRLGDIVIAAGVARRQARAAGHSQPTELRILALHGLLHLLGYDHERDNGRMRRVEARLLKRHGLPSGLIARTHGERHRRPSRSSRPGRARGAGAR